jgi:CHAT domain-containing protein
VTCPRVDVTELVARLDQEAGRSAAERAALAPRSEAEALKSAEDIFGTAIRTRDPALAELYATFAQRELESAFGPAHPTVVEVMAKYRVEEGRCQEQGVCGVFPDSGKMPLAEAVDLTFEDALRAALQGRIADANRLAGTSVSDGEKLLHELPVQRGQLNYRLGMLYLNELQEPKLASDAFGRAAQVVRALSSTRSLYPDEQHLRARVDIGVVRAVMAAEPAASSQVAKQYAGLLAGDSWANRLDADAVVARDFINHAARGCASKDEGGWPGGPVEFAIPSGYRLLRLATCSNDPLNHEVDALLRRYASSLERARQSYDVAGWDAAGSLLRNAVISLALAGRASPSQAFEAVALSELNGPSRLLSVPTSSAGLSPSARDLTSCLYADLAGRALSDLASSGGLSTQTTSLWSYAAPVEKRLDVGIADALEKLAAGPIEPVLRKQLPPGSALVEFVAYQPYSLAEADAGAPWGPVHYAALVVSPGSATRLVPIRVPAQIVDEQIRELRANIQLGDSRHSKAVFDVLFAPVLEVVKARRLYVVPGGAIELVPFMALHDGRDFLVRRGPQIVTLVSAFDLAAGKAQTTTSKELRILAAPHYGSGERRRPPESPCPFPASDLSELAETRLEADALAELWPGTVQNLTGHAASVAALRGGPAPAVLHIASHALLGGKTDAKRPPLRSSLWQRQRSASFTSVFCSRIALAGANEANQPPGDDGWLSAIEARFVPLEGTQLVVLSACETGASAGSIGEGSFGLKSAFLAAGALAVVSSLWPVESDATTLYMTSVYRHLVSGADKADALYAAAREFADGRKTPGFSSPSIWAAFVLTGDATPLAR